MITKEMLEHFTIRTSEHISRVMFNMLRMSEHDGLGIGTIYERAMAHDESKYSESEKEAYIYLTEHYRCKRLGIAYEYPKGIQDKVDMACKLHVKTNKHHPEAWHDCNDMQFLDLVEMVADWKAMSQELNQHYGSPRIWATENIDRWKFTSENKQRIFKIIHDMDERTK